MEHQEVCRGHSRGSPSGKNCPRDQDFWWRIQWLLHEENEEKGERLELKNLGVENNFMKLRIINGHVSRKKIVKRCTEYCVHAGSLVAVLECVYVQ